tara:strand:+ start:392 stop:802 length:411 start_codon:yes stop_codon:yes gene_type:complete
MINFELSYEKRLNLNKDAGKLIHSFGEGYFIIDEYGREVNTFTDQEEFDNLIEKFRYRQFLIEKLNKTFDKIFEFREDNAMFIDNKRLKKIYWDLPKNEEEVSLFFDYIKDKYKSEIITIGFSKDKNTPFDESQLP